MICVCVGFFYMEHPPVPSTLPPPIRIRLSADVKTKQEAIAQVAQLLIASGCVDKEYEKSIARREAVANTFLGHGVAIPHGLGEDRHLIHQDGIAVLQLANPLEWNPDQTTRLVIGIAAQSDAHIMLLRRLTRLIQNEAILEKLFNTKNAADIEEALRSDTPPAQSISTPTADFAEQFTWVLPYPNGLHARPATRWAETARGFSAKLQVRKDDIVADGKSLVSLLQLGACQNESLVISAEGNDSTALLETLKTTMESLTAQEKNDAERAKQRKPIAISGWKPPQAEPKITGIPASPGIAIAPVYQLQVNVIEVNDIPVALGEGGTKLHEAIQKTHQQLTAIYDDTQRRLGASEAAIFQAHAELLNDTDLITRTCQLMVEGHGTAWSWHCAVEEMANRLEKLANPVLAARAADVRDVGRRVLAQLDTKAIAQNAAQLPDHPFIMLASDLSPSETVHLDPQLVCGLITAQGGPTSHTAILSRTLGLPAFVAAGPDVLKIKNGTVAIIDGSNGCAYLNPSPEDLAAAEAHLKKLASIRQRETDERAQPAQTCDGHRLDVSANVNFPEQASFALTQGAEGVGLMRTEFLFLEKGSTPTEDGQYETYCQMAEALEGNPFIVRALDIGGDKQVAHLNLPKEENPFLGVRGSRLLLRRYDLLYPQLRALYRAAKNKANLSIMFPMITSVSEVIQLKNICEQIREELSAPKVPIGIMIEVPAAAMQADVLAHHADFFSIGTNDLTQYVLAIDRQNPELAAETDSLHPAVLRMIDRIVQGAACVPACWVGVCGGLAGEPFGASLLAGLGVHELSMTPLDIPAVKAQLRRSNLSDLRDLAQRALSCETADQVRALQPRVLEEEEQ